MWYPLTRTALERQESLQTQQRQRSPCVDGEIDEGRNDEIVGVGLNLNLKSLDERRARPTITVAFAVTIFMVESLSLLVRCPLSVEASTMLLVLVLVWCTDGVRRRCWCWPGGAPTENQPVKRNSVDQIRTRVDFLSVGVFSWPRCCWKISVRGRRRRPWSCCVAWFLVLVWCWCWWSVGVGDVRQVQDGQTAPPEDTEKI